MEECLSITFWWSKKAKSNMVRRLFFLFASHPLNNKRKQATVQCVTHLKKSTSDEHTFRWSVAGGRHVVLAQLLDKHPEWRGSSLDTFPSGSRKKHNLPSPFFPPSTLNSF